MLIDVKNLSFGYGPQNIFSGINFSLDKGEILCLLGPNGSGKTTLLDCILGVLKPREGHIFIDGEDTRTCSRTRMAKHISYVPQKHEDSFPYTVFEMVLMGRTSYISMFSSPSKNDRNIVLEVLDQIGITHFKNSPYTKLSGGEKQLVLIARALSQRTPVIIMDEPTSHLDFRHEFIVLETIMKLVVEKQISIIMATHFPNHAFYFESNFINTNVAMLHHSHFIHKGPPDEVLTQEHIKMLYGIRADVISFNKNGRKLKSVIPLKHYPDR